MKVLGIISEYNPLHSGHVYHIEASRDKINTTHTLCVMSGQFVQRGEPAIVDKWARASMALQAGVDLVLELPVVFSCASAELFAYGAVRMLHHTGIVDFLCFGSEQGEIGSLWRIASILRDEPSEFKSLLKKHLKSGLSFPAAREKALMAYLRELPENIISQSNNILAIEYLKALKKMKSSIQPVTVKRMGSLHQDTNIASSFSSATSIRNYIGQGGSLSNPLLSGNLPLSTQNILQKCFMNNRGPVFPEAFSSIILHRLRTMDAESLKNVPDVQEGLENRLISSAMQTGTLEDLIESVSTSRYPYTRIKRIVMDLLLGISKTQLKSFLEDGSCGYLRVLGFNEKGRELLQQIQKKASLPLIIKVSNHRNQLTGLSREMFEYDIRSTNTYVLGYSDPAQRTGDQDYTVPVVRI